MFIFYSHMIWHAISFFFTCIYVSHHILLTFSENDTCTFAWMYTMLHTYKYCHIEWFYFCLTSYLIHGQYCIFAIIHLHIWLVHFDSTMPFDDIWYFKTMDFILIYVNLFIHISLNIIAVVHFCVKFFIICPLHVHHLHSSCFIFSFQLVASSEWRGRHFLRRGRM